MCLDVISPIYIPEQKIRKYSFIVWYPFTKITHRESTMSFIQIYLEGNKKGKRSERAHITLITVPTSGADTRIRAGGGGVPGVCMYALLV